MRRNGVFGEEREDPEVEAPDEKIPEFTAADWDGWAAEDMEGGKEEARAWLKGEKNGIFEMGNAPVIKLTDDLYTAGAENVWITGIESFGGDQLSASMAVELPGEAEMRGKVFAVDAKFRGMNGEGPAKDVGQNFLTYYFD